MNPINRRKHTKRIALIKCICLYGILWLILIIMIIVTLCEKQHNTN